MKITKIVSTTAIFMLLSMTTQAKDFSYNYAEVGYSKYNKDVDRAFNVNASYSVGSEINVIAKYSKVNLKPTDGSLSEAEIGVGFHVPVNNKTDFIGSASVLKVKHGKDRSESGFGLEFGMRHHITNNIEANFKIAQKDIYNTRGGDVAVITIGSRYHINDSISAGVDFSTPLDEDPKIITSSLRWSTL